MSSKKLIFSDCVIAVCAAATGVGLLTGTAAVSEGIRNGLKVCANVLIPSLFPFMALAGFLSLTSAARILSIPLEPVTTKILRLPKELGSVVLMSLVGGYPVGAKSISMLLAQGKISKSTAERMLCFCVNSGPSFLISAVGAGMLFSKTAGIILFFTQTLSTLIIGAAVSRKAKIPRTNAVVVEARGAEAFVEAVSGASSAMLAMCSFAVLFSGVLYYITGSGVISALARLTGVNEAWASAIIGGIFEVSAGCISASKIGGPAGFAIISAAVSFGGLSVLFQIMSCFRENNVRILPLILARIAHVFLSLATAMPLYSIFCETQNVFAPSAQPIAYSDSNTALISVCLLCMCVIMTLSEIHK